MTSMNVSASTPFTVYDLESARRPFEAHQPFKVRVVPAELLGRLRPG